MKTLEDAKSKLDNQGYVLGMYQGVLRVTFKGTNENVYVFTDENAMMMGHKLSLSGLVTKVIVVGKEDSEGRVAVKATVLGKIEYGVLQDIVTSDDNKSIEDAKKEGDKIIKEKGKPTESIQIDAPDVPSTRQGHKIKVVAGNLRGYFLVKSVSHSATSCRMNMNVERVW